MLLAKSGYGDISHELTLNKLQLRSVKKHVIVYALNVPVILAHALNVRELNMKKWENQDASYCYTLTLTTV